MMRKILFILSFILLGACTDSSRLKEMAVKEAQEKYLAQLRAEALTDLASQNDLRKRYLHTLEMKIESDIEESQIQDSNAKIKVSLSVVPQKVKDQVLSVLSSYSGDKVGLLNVEDVLNEVRKKLNISRDTKQTLKYDVYYEKGTDWTLVRVISQEKE